MGGGYYVLFGKANGFNECGILYDSPSILPECLRLLKNTLVNVELHRIDERSPIASFIPDEAAISNNVAIYFGESYDEYFKKLSSSVRQNIRTAYNRLAKDGNCLNVKIFIGKSKIPINEIIWLYCRRHRDRYGVETSFIKRWFLKHQSFATRFYRYADNAITVYMTINDIPAAFLSGLYNNNRMIVPRLSINNDFKRYSPGMILVCETIKKLISDTKIRVLDLSLGEEPYKYQLGGVLHHAYRFNL